MTPNPRSTWDRRIERAAELEKEIPSAAEPLRFYQTIACFQREIFRSATARAALLSQMMPLLTLVERTGPAPLAQAATDLCRNPAAWQSLLDGAPTEPAHAFFSRVLRQPRAEYAAAHSDIALNETRTTCPFCAERPVAAVFRPEGEGGKRHLLCSLCFSEWEFRRLLCPNCGEEDRDQLPVYRAEELPHIRVEACDSCRHYIKAVDLTVNGLAVPEVDELAAVPMDLWAAEKDYEKITCNLLGF